VEADVTSNPVIAWCTVGVKRQLESYARSQGEAVEMVAGDLICAALRARKVPPAVDELPAPLPPVGLVPEGENFRCGLRAAPTNERESAYVLTRNERKRR
jgi:hypothetical protein